MQQLICASCGHVGNSKAVVKGSMLVEIFLWLLFILPGLIYSVWRSSSRYKACSSCGSTNLIPVDSPVGRKLLADQGKTLEELPIEKTKISSVNKAYLWMGGIVLFFFLLGIINMIGN